MCNLEDEMKYNALHWRPTQRENSQDLCDADMYRTERSVADEMSMIGVYIGLYNVFDWRMSEWRGKDNQLDES